jgi:protein involved in polysaccharide export with SLBB domain
MDEDPLRQQPSPVPEPDSGRLESLASVIPRVYLPIVTLKPIPAANGANRSFCPRPFSSLRALLRAVGCVWLVLAVGACTSAPPFDAKAVATEWVAFMQRDYVLRPGDRLSIRVDQLAGQGETRDNVQEVVVSPTGTLDLRQLPGPLQVGGKSVGAMRTLVVEAYKNQFSDPRVSVSLAEAAAQSVYVCGEVFRPGPVAYQAGLTMTQAIASAGSFIHTVKHSDIRILRINQDGTQRTTRVNMDAILRDEQPDFLLLPGDVIYAQTSGIADAGNWVDLWIRRLLPFQIGGPALGTIN